MTEKKPPMRMCVACRESKPKREMFRIVKNAEGVRLDITGKLAGRGAYFCGSEACLKRMRKAKLLNKAFSEALDDSVYAAIEEEFFAFKKD